MRAVTVAEYGGAEVLVVRERAIPEPGQGEIRIAVEVAGVNPADVAYRSGRYPGGPKPPFVPGIEVAGRVDAVGPGVDRRPGERVIAVTPGGGYADAVVVDTDRVFPWPGTLGPRTAAAVPVQWLTAHNACFEWGDLDRTEIALVTGAAGGVGGAIVQLAAGAGATVIGVASTERKREHARSLGCERVTDYDGIQATVEGIADAGAVDIALDGVGGAAFDAAVSAVRPGGRIVSYGMASGSVPTVAVPRLYSRNKRVIGYHLEEALERTPASVKRGLRGVLALIDDANIPVARTFDLGDADRAHDALADRERIGKVLLRP